MRPDCPWARLLSFAPEAEVQALALPARLVKALLRASYIQWQGRFRGRCCLDLHRKSGTMLACSGIIVYLIAYALSVNVTAFFIFFFTNLRVFNSATNYFIVFIALFKLYILYLAFGCHTNKISLFIHSFKCYQL